MKKVLLALMLLPVAACTQTTAADPKLGAREAKDLARILEGKVAGEPVSCITAFRSANLRSLGDNTLIYEASKDLVYRNTPSGPCSGLARGDTLIMVRTSSQYCRGDLARVVNLPSGMQSGSCVLGDFVPYKTAGK